jgi:hypothetical protein
MFGTFFWSFVLAVAVLSLVKRYRRRAKKAQPARERHALDTWVESVVAAELARRMPWDEGELVNTLRTSPEPAVVGAIERSLRSVEMRFTRLPLGAEAEVKVDVSFERGENHQVTKRVRWGDLPEIVRQEFDTKGAAVVFRRWQLPWSNTSTWSALALRSIEGGCLPVVPGFGASGPRVAGPKSAQTSGRPHETDQIEFRGPENLPRLRANGTRVS